MKEWIHLHRSHKRLAHIGRGPTALLALIVLVIDAAIAWQHERLLRAFVERVSAMADAAGVRTVVTWWEFLPTAIRHLPVLDAAGRYPSRILALWTFVIALLVVLLMRYLRVIPGTLRVYIIFLGLITVVSAAFFVLWPYRFPYDVLDFSLLYMGTQLGMWLLLPLVLGTVLAPLPSPTLEKAGVILFGLAYAALFGAVRYAAFLYLLHRFTVLHMAAMFFALGPLIDFVYLVAIYSVYVNIVALRLRRRPETWRWSF
jgi:hypothetical protein